MRLIMNFNRLAFESFGFDGYERAEIDAYGPNKVMILLSNGSDGKAFAPCNEGSNSTEGERERYKARWNEDEVAASGLIGSARYTVDSDPTDREILYLELHSYIIAGQPESYQQPMASVSYTEVNGRTKAEAEKNLEAEVIKVLLGGDPVIIMNTLRMSVWGKYKTGNCWLKGSSDPTVCHIRPWNTGDDQQTQRDLLMDIDNVILMRHDLQAAFANGDFSIKSDGTLIFADGVDPVEDLGFSQKVIDLGRKPRLLALYSNVSPGMKEYFRWYRKNVFRG